MSEEASALRTELSNLLWVLFTVVKVSTVVNFQLNERTEINSCTH